MFPPEIINSRRLQKLQKTLVFVWRTFKITLFYLNCYKSLLFIAYFSMSTLSVTICSARNAKWFEKIKKLFFWQCFSKNNQRVPKSQIQPHVSKGMSCIYQERVWWYWSTLKYCMSNTDTSFTLPVTFFPCYFVYWAICTRPKFVPTVTVFLSPDEVGGI